VNPSDASEPVPPSPPRPPAGARGAGEGAAAAAVPLPPIGPPPGRQRVGFGEDFRRFFLRGAAALLPTLVTLWLITWLWNFLWDSLGQYIIAGIKWTWATLVDAGVLRYEPYGHIGRYWSEELYPTRTRVVGVLLAVLLVYIVGVFVGNFIGRAMWRLAEVAVMKVPLVRAIYPVVKQVTDFLIADRSARAGQFAASRVVAVKQHASDIWSIGLVTGRGLPPLTEATGDDMVTVFCPSTPTAFSGYVALAPRRSVVELPLTVEEAMRLLVSGGVLAPGAALATPTTPAQALKVDDAPPRALPGRAAGRSQPTDDPPPAPGPPAAPRGARA
jgi:uncharacterized membrane protein